MQLHARACTHMSASRGCGRRPTRMTSEWDAHTNTHRVYIHIKYSQGITSQHILVHD